MFHFAQYNLPRSNPNTPQAAPWRRPRRFWKTKHGFQRCFRNGFYGGMDNIDIVIEEGNLAAIAVRFHVAQHSYLRHMNFDIGTARRG